MQVFLEMGFSQNILQFASHEYAKLQFTTGPVDKFVQRHPSGIIYHLCYETDNLSAALAGLEAAGLRPMCISPATPAPLFGGRPVSFYNVVGMGLVEILESQT